jgi:NAD-dependent SIR2 family protein deacetylase
MHALNASLEQALAAPGPLIFLTGAGISAESHIPTFRGEEGYWRAESRRYQPQELATRAAFARLPELVWSWYLWRWAVCSAAHPNAAHLAIARAAQLLGERVLLITQNVDGLHGRAGSPPDRTYEVHGNIARMRCSERCPGSMPLPALPAHPRELRRCRTGSSSKGRRGNGCPKCWRAWRVRNQRVYDARHAPAFGGVHIALRSLPGPLRTYTNEPRLLLPMYLPFTWIIPICVAGALFGHVVVLRWALGRRAAVA